jgi:hypothetical protein
MNYRTFICLFFGLILINLIAFSQQQPENPGFELWEEIGYGADTLEPVNWSSLKTSDGGDIINDVIPVVWERSTDSHSGMYSIKLINMPILTMIAPGTLTNGRVHATLPPSDAYVYTIDTVPDWNSPFTDKPDSLNIWAKFFPQGMDVAHVIAILHTDTAKVADSLQTNWVAVASIDIENQVDGWTKFSTPFVYLNEDTPEYILFAIYAGDAANALEGSILFLDDIHLSYYNTLVESTQLEDVKMYFSGNNLVVGCENSNPPEILKLKILDMSGRVVHRSEIPGNHANKVSVDIPHGVYICSIQTGTAKYSMKLIKD